MKNYRQSKAAVGTILIAMFMMTLLATSLGGCATDPNTGRKILNPAIFAKIDEFNAWAKPWVEGARAGLPMILAVAGTIPAAQPYVDKAKVALADADLALATYSMTIEAVKKGASTPEEAVEKQLEILSAIEGIKAAVSQIQGHIKG